MPGGTSSLVYMAPGATRLVVAALGAITVESTGDIDVASGGDINIASGGQINIASGGQITAAGTQASHIADAVVAHNVNSTFSDTEVEAALNALGAKINAILVVIEGIGATATS